MGSLQNSTAFLKYGGGVLLIVGLVGVIGILNSVDFFSLDAGENVAHIGLGVIGLAAGFGLKDVRIHRGLTAVVGITALIFGLLGWFLPSGGALLNGAFAKPNFLGYGEGWELSDYRGRKLAWHTGGWPGMVSRLTLVPLERRGHPRTRSDIGIRDRSPRESIRRR